MKRRIGLSWFGAATDLAVPPFLFARLSLNIRSVLTLFMVRARLAHLPLITFPCLALDQPGQIDLCTRQRQPISASAIRRQLCTRQSYA